VVTGQFSDLKSPVPVSIFLKKQNFYVNQVTIIGELCILFHNKNILERNRVNDKVIFYL